MGIQNDFNNKGYELRADNDYVLGVYFSSRRGSNYYSYDFMAKILLVTTGTGDGGTAVTPFSQLDPGTLEMFRDKLIELGGHPPELATAAPEQAAKKTGQLNL